MRYLITSDVHNSPKNIIDLLMYISEEIDEVFFLGDGLKHMESLALKYPHIPFHMVAGNCDYFSKCQKEESICVSNKKIWLTHGHVYNVKSGYDRLTYAAEEKNADICLFGHTHYADVFTLNDVLYINPGSISSPRMHQNPTYAVLTVEDKIDYSIIEVYGDKKYRRIS